MNRTRTVEDNIYIYTHLHFRRSRSFSMRVRIFRLVVAERSVALVEIVIVKTDGRTAAPCSPLGTRAVVGRGAIRIAAAAAASSHVRPASPTAAAIAAPVGSGVAAVAHFPASVGHCQSSANSPTMYYLQI